MLDSRSHFLLCQKRISTTTALVPLEALNMRGLSHRGWFTSFGIDADYTFKTRFGCSVSCRNTSNFSGSLYSIIILVSPTVFGRSFLPRCASLELCVSIMRILTSSCIVSLANGKGWMSRLIIPGTLRNSSTIPLSYHRHSLTKLVTWKTPYSVPSVSMQTSVRQTESDTLKHAVRIICDPLVKGAIQLI